MLPHLLRNAGVLLTGNTVSSLFGVFSLVAMARALGPEQLGTLAIIQAYASTMGVLFNFQSWHMVVKFGSDALARDDNRAFGRLVFFGTLLDASSALLGAGIAALAAFAVAPLLGWDESTTHVAAMFCITIALDLSGTPKAVLRIFDRFSELAMVQVGVAVLKFIAVLFALFTDAAFPVFLAITGAALILNHLLLLSLAWHLLRQRGDGAIRPASIRQTVRENPGIWQFVWTTNLSSGLGIVTKEFDIVIVGGLLGSNAAGLYRVARQFASLLSRPLEALYHAVYPELTRLWASKDVSTFRSLMVRGGIGAGSVAVGLWCVLWLWGEALLGLSVGPGYVSALPVLLWYSMALVVGTFGFSLEPAGYAMGIPQKMLAVHAASTLLYVVILPQLLWTSGLVGAGIAALIFQLTWATTMIVVQRKSETHGNS